MKYSVPFLHQDGGLIYNKKDFNLSMVDKNNKSLIYFIKVGLALASY